MQIHGSCAARDGAGVLLIGPSGSGKSDLLLRLLDRGFLLVADDRVDIVDGIAQAPPRLAGLVEVRGLGIFRLPHAPSARIALVADLGTNPGGPKLGGAPDRLPMPMRHPDLDVPMIRLDATASSAAHRIALALDCASGRVLQCVGAFAA